VHAHDFARVARHAGQPAAAGLPHDDADPGRQPAPRPAGNDLIAQAKTGSGKTAAFALALLANLNPRRFAVQALVLCPTRELADQVTRKSAAWRGPKTTSRS
jgi:Rad3-related DNA helicase